MVEGCLAFSFNSPKPAIRGKKEEEEGKEEGKEEGRGQNLIHNIEAAMKNFGISLEKACAGLDVTVEEYQRVKAQNVRTD